MATEESLTALSIRTSTNRVLKLTIPSTVRSYNYDVRLSIGFEISQAINTDAIIARMADLRPPIHYRVRQEDNKLLFDFRSFADRDVVIANPSLADLVPSMTYNQSTNRTGRRFVLIGVPHNLKNLKPSNIQNHVTWFREEIA